MKVTKHYKFKIVVSEDETIHEEVFELDGDAAPELPHMTPIEDTFPIRLGPLRPSACLRKHRRKRTEVRRYDTSLVLSMEDLLRHMQKYVDIALNEHQAGYLKIVPVKVDPPPDPAEMAKRQEAEELAKKQRDEAEAKKKKERQDAKEKKERAQLERLQEKYGKLRKDGPGSVPPEGATSPK